MGFKNTLEIENYMHLPLNDNKFYHNKQL